MDASSLASIMSSETSWDDTGNGGMSTTGRASCPGVTRDVLLLPRDRSSVYATTALRPKVTAASITYRHQHCHNHYRLSHN
jgi:hypothetical protein